MAETRPIQVFLCHASEDKAAVLDIYDRLRALGDKPWVDKKDLLPGQLWEEEIPKAIRVSDFIPIFLSKNSIPKQGYVQTELNSRLMPGREYRWRVPHRQRSSKGPTCAG
jgi:TIR domain